MNDQEKIEFKANIEKKIERLKTQIIELKDLTQPIAPDSSIGRISRMDAINNKSVNEAALRQKEQQLKALEIALMDFDSPNFGICIQCGNQIPSGRILLMPESKKCITCAQ